MRMLGPVWAYVWRDLHGLKKGYGQTGRYPMSKTFYVVIRNLGYVRALRLFLLANAHSN
jgi:hypothetical protein